VTLHTSDGVDLAAWYVPSRNGAAIVLVHGAGGDRAGGIESRAALLARHGYGVLLYDARGGGESGGRVESMGWTWHRDAAAAVDFLAARGIGRIGALGLSTGAETVLEAAGRDPRIRAVVADGAQTRRLAEMRLLPHSPENLLYTVDFGSVAAVYRVLSLQHQPPSLVRMVEQTRAPLLLISSGTGFERDAGRLYARHAVGPATLWELPRTEHTGGLKAFPRAYDRRVTAFFDRTLLR
jgi:pimeloyl-ACP methyl ester carboxylesterase